MKRSYQEHVPDSIFVVTVLVRHKRNFNNPSGRITTTRSIERLVRKALSQREWTTISDDLEYCDLWGMQPHNGRQGFDGSDLSIFAKRRIGRDAYPHDKKFVSRWAPEGTALGKLFSDVYKMSGVKVDCYDR
ncbi:MAG: hypothetical protein EOP50_16650 [Sphingobacteriales bacterium]|nr:MAG: hypothetical protein EOP50_16650 [Sphingobacteriales bacterium]